MNYNNRGYYSQHHHTVGEETCQLQKKKKYVCFNGTQFDYIINTSAFDLKYHGLYV